MFPPDPHGICVKGPRNVIGYYCVDEQTACQANRKPAESEPMIICSTVMSNRIFDFILVCCIRACRTPAARQKLPLRSASSAWTRPTTTDTQQPSRTFTPRPEICDTRNMAHLLRGKQAGVPNDLSTGIASDLFVLDHVGSHPSTPPPPPCRAQRS
jgi:hypothetical protein